MKRTLVVFRIIAILALTFSITFTSASSAWANNSGKLESTDQVYIVQMLDKPVVAYEGDIKGYKATKPENGKKVDPFAADTLKYVGYLKEKHNAAVNQVGGGQILYDYTFSYNGFAAVITEQQAEKMEKVPGVLTVQLDVLVDIDTSSTPTFLGLTDPGGLWDQLGGIGKGGEDIIIGVIDSGIWPESLSFSDRTGTNGNNKKSGKLDYTQIPGWHGKCVPGEEFNASMCNQKLIGAQYFNASWGGDAGIEFQRPWEFTSARDYNGHGTHTSSTAGGNYGVPTTGPAAAFGPISGIAPRARIAMYKALWSTEDGSTASGYTADLVAAIDQAVADGVDVINYSISGSLTNFLDAAEVAFLFAADAGVFVAASAGNSGPAVSTVAHPSPWITTVAAGTHNRSMEGSVTLGNGVTYYGASMATPVGPAPLIDSIAAGLPGADPTALALCYSSLDGGNELDPALVAGKIVICDRGVTARVNKSLAVKEAGGVGMILVNTGVSSINADFHAVPTVHLAVTDRAAVKTYAATAGATATINSSTSSYTAPAPFTASFSSRGPLIAGAGDLLKPDVIAPGQDILAAVSPVTAGGMNFNLLSGTSMSSPHVAGLAALLMDLHPDWTPMMVKSALMTSAYDVLDGPNTNPLVIFRQGAGHVRPNSAMDPGLVFNSGLYDWFAFLCSTTTGVNPSTCAALASMGYPTDPSDFNGASIAIGALAGTQTVTRTVTNVGGRETYTFSYSGLVGTSVTPSISSFTVQPGEKKDFSVTFTTTIAALNAYVGGYITWTGDKGHVVRIPVVLKPVALAAPAEVSGSYDVSFGYSGPFSATPRGLVPAVTFAGEVNTGENVVYTVVIPAGTTYARFSLFDEFVSPTSDLDLYVFNSAGTQVGGSGSGTSDEEVNFMNLAAGTYYVMVDGYATGNPSTFTLFTWALGSADAGNMTVSAPTTAVLGQFGTIDLTFSGLTSGTKYLGSIVYGGAAGMPNPTIVRVDP
ncbi:MAG: S8 family serine peptidase [Anaerolineaceae bacterium]